MKAMFLSQHSKGRHYSHGIGPLSDTAETALSDTDRQTFAPTSIDRRLPKLCLRSRLPD